MPRLDWSSVSRSLLLVSLLPLAACDMGKLTVNTTSKVLVRAQPSHPDRSPTTTWRARAIPATLKTVEGFHVVNPDNESLTSILAEGYCQYATGFVEDEWEVAELDKKFDEAEYHSERATKMFMRCMGYGARACSAATGTRRWPATSRRAGQGGQGSAPTSATALLWTAIGLAGAINQNKDDIAMVAHLPKARALLEQRGRSSTTPSTTASRPPAPCPTSRSACHGGRAQQALGGKPELADEHFKRGHRDITGGKFLLAKVLYARRYAVAVQDRALFHKSWSRCWRPTRRSGPSSGWPTRSRTASARRYLKREKEWF